MPSGMLHPSKTYLMIIKSVSAIGLNYLENLTLMQLKQIMQRGLEAKLVHIRHCSKSNDFSIDDSGMNPFFEANLLLVDKG